jgi:Zn-dependent protease with chaperone function/uncharacterized tellurite resistance protein B-like protein
LWNPTLFGWAALGTLAVIGCGSLWRIMELSQGGGSVATMLGGQPLSPTTRDPDARKLLNVVEEMAIASGTPVPQVYVLPGENSINAFAAGHSTSDAAIGVTQGAMKLLTRDELQGVIGHEFSHILNGDMRLNIRLMGILFGILALALIGRVLLRTRGRKNPLPLLGLALLLIGWAGVLFGRLIQAAVSREREFLADASAVQFTRNPDGLAGALKKIGGLGLGSRVKSPRAAEASHMYFANGMGESFLNLMATHPPLDARIKALDPAFDGRFPVVRAEAVRQTADAQGPARRAVAVRVAGRPGGFGGAVPPVIAAAAVMPGVGRPGMAHLRYAADWRASLPPAVEEAARDPLGASAVIYALLLSADEARRRKQLKEFSALVGQGVYAETLRLLPDVAAVAARAKLPLVDVALPALRGMSPEQYERFSGTLQALIESDGEIDWFEYVLQKIVRRHLEPHFRGARKPVVQYYALRPLLPDCNFLLSVLAGVGQEDSAQAEAAFLLGWRELRTPDVEPQMLALAECGLEQLDAALNRLAQAAPLIKKNLLSACAQTVAADGRIKEEEAELLRAIADTLDCPIPPFVEGIQPGSASGEN